MKLLPIVSKRLFQSILSIQTYREISKIYLNTGIFTDYVREKPETIIKKSKTFKQGNFIKGYHPVDETSQSTLGFLELDEEMRDENSGGPAKNSGKEEEKIP